MKIKFEVCNISVKDFPEITDTFYILPLLTINFHHLENWDNSENINIIVGWITFLLIIKIFLKEK